MDNGGGARDRTVQKKTLGEWVPTFFPSCEAVVLPEQKRCVEMFLMDSQFDLEIARRPMCRAKRF